MVFWNDQNFEGKTDIECKNTFKSYVDFSLLIRADNHDSSKCILSDEESGDIRNFLNNSKYKRDLVIW